MTRDDCVTLDTQDPLARIATSSSLPAGVIYLDGNSLGALPRAAIDRVAHVVEHEWGEGLIRSWNAARWIDLPRRVGAKIAHLIGAQTHEVICADSTSINLFKVLTTALRLQASRPQVSLRERKVILSEKTNFPTDLYVAQGVIDLLGQGHEIRLVEFDEVADAIDDRTAVVMLTHVNFRTGAMHDDAGAHKPRAQRRRSDGVGPVALRRRGAGRPERRSRRLRRRMRLQILERRSRCAGVRFRCQPPSRCDRRRHLRSTARRLAGPSRAVRVRRGLSTRGVDRSLRRRHAVDHRAIGARSGRRHGACCRHRCSAREVDRADAAVHRAGRTALRWARTIARLAAQLPRIAAARSAFRIRTPTR